MTNAKSRGSVAYLGPAGTYSHAAVLKYFGQEQACLPMGEIPEVFACVAEGRSEFGVVPVENSSEGSVALTLDCFSGSELRICGEVLLRINHFLLAAPGTRAADITRIVSHPQSLGQCRQWLKQHYPQVERLAVSSNGEAAQIASREPGTAAIAGQSAGKLYGLTALAEHIEDAHDNTTRFLVIGRDCRSTASGRDKTSIVISAPNEPGTLFRALEPFHRHGVSLSKLESRPSRKAAWSYSFYIDIDGHRDDPAIHAALADLAGLALDVKLLGSYPAART